LKRWFKIRNSLDNPRGSEVLGSNSISLKKYVICAKRMRILGRATLWASTLGFHGVGVERLILERIASGRSRVLFLGQMQRTKP
jgi:dipeptidase